MRESEHWRQVCAMPKGKERNKRFSELKKSCVWRGLTENGLRTIANNHRCAPPPSYKVIIILTISANNEKRYQRIYNDLGNFEEKEVEKKTNSGILKFRSLVFKDNDYLSFVSL